MKKIVILLLLAAAVTAQAQFTVGINTGFNINRDARADHSRIDYTYSLTPNLFLGYRFGNNISVGVTGNLGYYCDAYHQYYHSDQTTYGTPYRAYESLLWTAGLFTRYDIPLTEHLSVFADLTISLGSTYSRSKRSAFDQSGVTEYSRNLNDGKVLLCNAVLTPGVSYRFNSHLSADLHLDLLQIAYRHFTLSPKEAEAEPNLPVQVDNYNVYFDDIRFGSRIYIPYSNQAYFSSTFRIGINYTF